MGLLDRLRRRRTAAREEPVAAVRAPSWRGEPQARVHADPERIVAVAVTEVARRLAQEPRPRLELHWASWDEGSLRVLPTVQALLARHPHLHLVSMGWDAFLEAPTGRIPGMAQRPARWSDGSELAAYHRHFGLPGRTWLLQGEAETLRSALGLPGTLLPVLSFVPGPQGEPLHHCGLAEGPSWDSLVAAIR